MNHISRLRRAFESAPIGMACLDLQGCLRFANQALAQLLGCMRADLSGVRLITAFTLPQDAALEADLFLELVGGRRARYQLEKRYLRSDRQLVWASVNVTLVPGEGTQRPFCLSLIEDITARRRCEEHLRHTAKMDALARMAGEVVSRLNHLMVASLGSSRLLLEALPGHEPTRSLVETIRDAVDGSAALTRQLTAFCARQVLNPAPVDLNALILSALPKVRALAAGKVQVMTLLEPQIGQVQVDEVQIERVLFTLLENAVDAMPSGGKVTIRTAQVDGEAGSSAGARAGPQIELSVTDTGCGLDAKSLERLYEPFFTTKEQGRSHSLGLAAVYGIVQQSGGRLEVISEPGHGASFRLYLPRAHDTVVDLKLPAGLADTKPPAETVLLVEDDDALRAQMRRVLRAANYHVLDARYGGEALLLCLRHEGPIHLLIANAIMPHMTGRELAEQANHLRPDLRVLLLATPAEFGAPLGGDAWHAHLQKPITPEALGQKLREILRGVKDRVTEKSQAARTGEQ